MARPTFTSSGFVPDREAILKVAITLAIVFLFGVVLPLLFKGIFREKDFAHGAVIEKSMVSAELVP